MAEEIRRDRFEDDGDIGTFEVLSTKPEKDRPKWNKHGLEDPRPEQEKQDKK